MGKRTIALLNEEELEVIEDIFEKKVALENLIKIIDVETQEVLYNRLIADYTIINGAFSEWWNDNIGKYQLEGKEAYVDFMESTIYVLE